MFCEEAERAHVTPAHVQKKSYSSIPLRVFHIPHCLPPPPPPLIPRSRLPSPLQSSPLPWAARGGARGGICRDGERRKGLVYQLPAPFFFEWDTERSVMITMITEKSNLCVTLLSL